MTAAPTGQLACPACGVAVVPGYVRCPKCHAGLPYGSGRSKRTTVDPGGTSVETTRPPATFPVAAVVAAVVAGGAIALVLALHGRSPAATAATTTKPASATTPALPVIPPRGTIVLPPPSQPPATAPAPSAAVVADQLERSLKHQRLWSTVRTGAGILEVRSALCNDAGMTATVAGLKPGLQAAGIGRWRCIEESGQAVFEREL